MSSSIEPRTRFSLGNELYDDYEVMHCWLCNKEMCYVNWVDCGESLCFDCGDKLRKGEIKKKPEDKPRGEPW